MTVTKYGQRPSGQAGIPSVHLSISPHIIRLARGMQWGLSGIVVCAVLLSGWMGWEIHTVAQEAGRYTAAAERTDAANQQLKAQLDREHLILSSEQIASIQQDVLFVNQLAEKRRFSWTQLLHDLEETFPAGTSIGKIQRDAKASAITVDGHAASMGDLQALMTRLQTRPVFHQPVLHHHQLAASSQTDRGGDREVGRIEFSLTVQYQGLPKIVQPDDIS